MKGPHTHAFPTRRMEGPHTHAFPIVFIRKLIRNPRRREGRGREPTHTHSLLFS